MNTYKDDPDLALSTLEKIADEIASGVSAHDVGEIVTKIRRNPEEITKNLHEAIKNELLEGLKSFWEEQDVSEKLKMVKSLKCGKCPTRLLTVGEVAKVSEKKYLKFVKEELETRVNKLREENNNLEKNLKTKSNLFKQQMNEIDSFEFKP